MTNVAIRVVDISAPSPYDRFRVDFTVVAEGVSSGWSGDVYVDFTDSADAINSAVRIAAAVVAAGHSVTVGPTDVQRVFGGAMETPA